MRNLLTSIANTIITAVNFVFDLATKTIRMVYRAIRPSPSAGADEAAAQAYEAAKDQSGQTEWATPEQARESNLFKIVCALRQSALKRVDAIENGKILSREEAFAGVPEKLVGMMSRMDEQELRDLCFLSQESMIAFIQMKARQPLAADIIEPISRASAPVDDFATRLREVTAGHELTPAFGR